MGLDMWAIVAEAEKLGEEKVDLTLPEEHSVFAQWRNVETLHDWMNTVYEENGGKDDVFNQNTLRLYDEDLDSLEELLNSGDLFKMYPMRPRSYERDEGEIAEQIKAFIAKAREYLKEGKAVIYDSWW